MKKFQRHDDLISLHLLYINVAQYGMDTIDGTFYNTKYNK